MCSLNKLIVFIITLSMGWSVFAATDGEIGSNSSTGNFNVEFVHQPVIKVSLPTAVTFGGEKNSAAVKKNRNRTFTVCVYTTSPNGYRYKLTYGNAPYSVGDPWGTLKSESGAKVKYRIDRGTGFLLIAHQNTIGYNDFKGPFNVEASKVSANENCSDGKLLQFNVTILEDGPQKGWYRDVVRFKAEVR